MNILSLKIKENEDTEHRDDKTIHGTPMRDYQAVHYFLKKHYGRATICEGDNCSGISKRFTWALLHGYKYEKKRENFIQLCSSCHGKYDTTEHKRQVISIKLKGRKQPLTFAKGHCVTCKVDLPIPRKLSVRYCNTCFDLNVISSRKKWLNNNRERQLRISRFHARERFGYKKPIKRYAHEQSQTLIQETKKEITN